MNYNSNCTMHDYQIEVSNDTFIDVHIMVQTYFYGHESVFKQETDYTVDICFAGSDTDIDGARAYFDYYMSLKGEGFALDKRAPNEPKLKNAIYWHTLRKQTTINI